jgi:hypothetical protein
MKQAARISDGLPAFVVVIEFGMPQAAVRSQ